MAPSFPIGMKRYPRAFDRYQISIPFPSTKYLTGSRIADLTVKIAQAVEWSFQSFTGFGRESRKAINEDT